MSSSGSTDRAVCPSLKSPPPAPHSPSFLASPTSATQGLSHPGSFPASETQGPDSPETKRPQLMQKSAFEVQVFNAESVITQHSKPVITTSDAWRSPMETLFKRIQEGDRKFLQQLPAGSTKQKKIGIFIDEAHDKSGRTPLTAALLRGQTDIVVDLLMLGADPRIADGHGRTPKELAGANSMARIALEFIITRCKHHGPCQVGSEQDRKYQKLLAKIDLGTGHNLLTWAISQDHIKLVAKLIDSGADFRVCNRSGRSALAEACVSGRLAIVSEILDRWPTVVSNLNRHYLIAALRGAAEANRPMVLAHLLSFFRDEFRLQNFDESEAPDENPLDIIAPNPQNQQDSYCFILGGKLQSSAAVGELKRRTSDHWMLTPAESRLLELPKILAYAQKNDLVKIVDIIHAHARLPDDE